MNADAIPAELRERDQWLLWSHEQGKAPLNADGFNASWNDPSEWLAFDEALELVRSEDEFDGLGYVISEGDPYLGLDLDGCLREPFAEKPAGWLPGLDAFEGTYVEYSQSGTGIHVFTRGDDPPRWWSDSHFTDAGHEGVEAYAEKFFIVTGEPVETISGATIEEVDVVPFLADAYETINGEAPSLPGAEDRPDRDVELGIYDVISSTECPEGENGPHPFHGSGTGTNFRVDPGGETFRCWRHKVTGNALHLLGIEQGVIDCGEWTPGGLESDVWADVFDAGREAGYDLPEPATAANGGTAAAHVGAGGPASVAGDVNVSPDAVAALAGVRGIDEISKDRELAHYVYQTIREAGEGPFLATRGDGEIFVYRDGVWNGYPDGEQRLRELAAQALGASSSVNVFRELEAKVREQSTVARSALGRPANTVGTPEGLLDLETRELRAPTPEDYVLNQLIVAPDPEAPVEDSTWWAFVEEVVPDGAERAKLQEYAGYTMLPGQPFKKALFMVGPTDAGKGTFHKALESVLGSENVSHQSLHDLINSRWGTDKIYGKMVNVSDEVSPKAIKRVERFKKLTGGGDTVTAERKGQPTYEFTVTQKFIFATNQFPSVSHADDAFWNRCLFVEFPNTAEEPDPELLDRLREERPTILNWMLDGLTRLLEQGHFTNERSLDERRALSKSFGSPTEQFVYEVLDVTGDPDDVIHQGDLYEAFARFCHFMEFDETPIKGVFTKRLTRRPGVSSGRSRRINDPEDDIPPVYQGVRPVKQQLERIQADIPRLASAGDEDPEGQQSL